MSPDTLARSLPETSVQKETSHRQDIINEPPSIVYKLIEAAFARQSAETDFESFTNKLIKEAEKRYCASKASPWAAWQNTRHAGKSSRGAATGNELYYAGKGLSADEIVQEIAKLGNQLRKSTERLYPSGPRSWKSIIETLQGTSFSIEACKELNELFAMSLAKQRALMSGNPEAENCQIETYRALLSMPDVEYKLIKDPQEKRGFRIEERYSLPLPLPAGKRRPELKLPTNPSIIEQYQPPSVVGEEGLDPQHNPYHLMYVGGKVGHPLFRQALSQISQ